MDGQYQCSFCGRKVNPTVHSKNLPHGFKVDYYLVWTGKLTPMIMKNPRDEREVIQFFRLEQAHPLIACVDCYKKDEVKKELEKAFKEVPQSSLLEANEEEEK